MLERSLRVDPPLGQDHDLVRATESSHIIANQGKRPKSGQPLIY
ncbi:MAG: hypothetical protein AVDCRST_MAG43-379 [uncultured Thermomicrobiales bacterium]|uniref:Uncharacterized protein n=1 Tax=uncultured Thermomicrobiales bacterium TaxID=1645740 RepID=A0A6J4U9Z8_9BACT|nr:MAG: hypothetical protein AVDCRST_MAG43-379 [uncultured Thermomicrobiales bacterium]